jgi:ComF family protein
MINKWLKNVLSVCYPPTCVLCGSLGHEGLDLCQACYKDMPHNEHSCPQCANPLPPSSSNLICGVCQKHTPAYDRTLSLFVYSTPVDRLILRLKFNYKLELGRLLGTLMARNLEAKIEKIPQLIIPLPLHHKRLRERGYNQAVQLAKPIAKQLNVPLDKHYCHRVRDTAQQSQLPRHERQKNVRGAFALRPGFSAKHVAIVDDVMTTGQTVNELARLLRKNGVEYIEVWVCARASGL